MGVLGDFYGSIARFSMEIDYILATRKLKNREQLDPITQNKIIEHCMTAHRVGLINKRELLNWIDEIFDYDRTETLVNAEEVLLHYQGRKSATARWKHLQPSITAEEYAAKYLQPLPTPAQRTTMQPIEPPIDQFPIWAIPGNRARGKEIKAIRQGQLAFNW